MQNPCRECDWHLAGGDKNDARCVECDARVAYAAAIGGIFGPDARYTKHMNGGCMNHNMTPDVGAAVPQTRTCNKCGETKPLDQFRKNHTCLHGREPVCRECRNEAGRQKTATARAKRLAAKPPKPVKPEDYVKTKECRVCKQTKALALFVTNKSCRDGRESICKACRAIYIAQKQTEKLMDAASPEPDQLSADMGMPLPGIDNSPAPPAEIGEAATDDRVEVELDSGVITSDEPRPWVGDTGTITAPMDDAATDDRVEVAWNQPSGLRYQPSGLRYQPSAIPSCVPISQNKWLERRCVDLLVAIYSHIDNGEIHNPALEGWSDELGRTLRARRLMEKEGANGTPAGRD